MKRANLIWQLRLYGYSLKREEGKHSVFENPRTKERIVVPRHREINEYTAKSILKQIRG